MRYMLLYDKKYRAIFFFKQKISKLEQCYFQQYVFVTMKSQEKAASFIGKLYLILRSKQHSKAIVWDTQAKGIKVLNQKKLQETVLPRYFRHNRFPSFVRQLNMYNFHKIHLGDHKSIFCHDQFDPKKKQSIYLIKRKVTFSVESSQKNDQDQISQKVQAQNERTPNSYRQFCFSENQSQIWSKQKSSFRLLKNSIRLISERKMHDMDEPTMTQEQAFRQIIQDLAPLQLNYEQLKKRLQTIKKQKKKFRPFLKSKSFKQKLYQMLGIEIDDQKQNLSELSIQEQLLINTRKTLTQYSLKMFQSGPINPKDTVKNLLNQ